MKMLNNLKKLVSDKNVVYNWICAVLLIVFFAVQFMPYWTFTVNVPEIEKYAVPDQIIETTYIHFSTDAMNKIDEEKKVAAVEAAEAKLAELTANNEAAAEDIEKAEQDLQSAKDAVAKIEQDKAKAAEVKPTCVGCKAELDVKAMNDKIASLDAELIGLIETDVKAYEKEPLMINEHYKTSARENIAKLDQDKLYIKCEACKEEFMSVYDATLRIVPDDREIGNFDEERSASVVDYVWFTYEHSAIEARKDLVSEKSGLEDYFSGELGTTVDTNKMILFPALFMAFAIFGVLFAILKPKSILALLFTFVTGICGLLGFITAPIFKLGSLFGLNIAIAAIVFAFATFVLVVRAVKKLKKA